MSFFCQRPNRARPIAGYWLNSERVLYLSISIDSCANAILVFLINESISSKMGKVERNIIEAHYAKNITESKPAAILNGVLREMI